MAQPAPPAADVRAFLDGIVRDSLWLIAAGVGGLFLLLSVLDWWLLPAQHRWSVFALALGTGLLLLGWSAVLCRRTPPVSWAHPLLGGISLLVLVNILVALAVRRVGADTSHVTIFLVGIGCVFLSVRWLAALAAAAVGGWAVVAGLVAPSPEWWQHIDDLWTGGLLSALVFTIRLRTYRRLYDARLRDAESRSRLSETVEALRRSERFNQRLADTAPFLLYVFDLAERRVVFMNHQFAVQLGYSPEDFRATGDQVIERLVHPDDHPVMEGLIARLVQAADGEVVEDTYRVCRADGAWRRVRSREVVFARNPDGSVRQVLGTAHDITDWVQAEERIRQLGSELVHASRLSLMGEMAVGLAHELHQPLEVIVNYANGCVRRLQSGRIEPDELAAHLGEIGDEALRAGEVIRRIRGFLQRGETQRRSVDLAAVVRDALRLAQLEQVRTQVQVEFDPPGDLPPVMADNVQIAQVVLNLVLNAIQAMSGTEGRQRRLTIGLRPTGEGQVAVSVADTGPGVPPEVQERLFDQFVTTKEHGLGMGLAISRSIVEAHEGRLWFTTQPGEGSVFHFTLPAAANGRTSATGSAA